MRYMLPVWNRKVLHHLGEDPAAGGGTAGSSETPGEISGQVAHMKNFPVFFVVWTEYVGNLSLKEDRGVPGFGISVHVMRPSTLQRIITGGIVLLCFPLVPIG